MYSSNIVYFPQQKLPSSKKDEEWCKKCVDAAERLALTGTSIRDSYLNKRANFNLANDILDQDDIQQVFNPLGFKSGSIPAAINNYNISMQKINLLLGEEKKRNFDYRFVPLNEDSVNYLDTVKKDKLFKITTEELQNALQTGKLNEQQLEKRLKDLDKYIKYDYKDIRELTANRIIKHLWRQQNIAFKKNLAFGNGLIASEELYRTDIVGGNPVFEVVDPLKLFTLRNGQSPYLEDADLIIEVCYLPIGKVIDNYYEYLSETDIEYLEGGKEGNNRAGAVLNKQILNPQWSIYDWFGQGTGSLYGSDGESLVVNEDATRVFGGMFNVQGEVRVMKVRWNSFLRRQKLIYFDETGERQEEIVDELYKLTEDDKLNGRKLEDFWIREWWETDKVGDLYLRMRPRPVQFRNMTNLAEAKSGYVGTYYNLNSNRARSLMDIMKPFQYLYNVTMRRVELAFAKYKTPILQLNTSLKPDGWDVDKWLYYADVHGLLTIDPFNEQKYGEATGKLSGTMNQFQNDFLSPTMGNYIQFHIEYLQYLERLLGKVSGVNDNREGQVSNNETVGGIERSVTQSSHITEYWFSIHEDTVRRALMALLETAKYAYKDNKNKSIPFVLDDMSVQLLNIDGELFNESEYDLYVSDNSNDTRIHSLIEQQIHPFMQNGGKLGTAVAMLRSNSITEITRKLEDEEDKMAEQQQQMQQQQVESAERIHQEKMQFEKYKVDLDAQVKREKIMADVANNMDGHSKDIDLNNNHVADDLERARNQLEKERLNLESEIEKAKLAEEIRNNKAKEQIELKKVQATKYKKSV